MTSTTRSTDGLGASYSLSGAGLPGPFIFERGELSCDGVALGAIARDFGTPTYVYSANHIIERYERVRRAVADLPHLICYAIKANGNLAIGRLLADRGAGADVVSVGEIYRAELMGFPPDRIVFAGVGKRDDEIEYALNRDIRGFNIESAAEVDQIEAIAARLGRVAPISIRVNPDVDPKTHPYISTGLRGAKFGVPFDEARRLYRRAAASPSLRPIGVQMHIGSQIVDPTPIADAGKLIIAFADELIAAGLPIHEVDIGGGLGVRYRDEDPPGPEPVIAAIRAALIGKPYTLVLEPGRFVVAEAGALLTRVISVKSNEAKRFVIVDAAMNDLIRPALYQAYHAIVPAQQSVGPETTTVDIVGPVCESGDFLAKDRELPTVTSGDLLAALTAGAYGFAMASNYNARPRAAEVLIEGGKARLIRRRETLADLVAAEVGLAGGSNP